MRPRDPSTRTVTALGASVLLLLAMAAPAAGRSELFTIEIDLDTNTETVHGSVCDGGEAITDFHKFAGAPPSRGGAFHLDKEIVCDDGSFWIRVDAGINFQTGGGTTGGWTVIPGSGTGAYAGLKGGGSIVGINGDGDPIDLVDHYSGRLST